MVRKIRNFIGNEYVEPRNEGKYEVFNPAFGEVIAKVSESTKEEVDNAIDLLKKPSSNGRKLQCPIGLNCCLSCKIFCMITWMK
jgi:NAD-dependent aldehyde dehydrogenases